MVDRLTTRSVILKHCFLSGVYKLHAHRAASPQIKIYFALPPTLEDRRGAWAGRRFGVGHRRSCVVGSCSGEGDGIRCIDRRGHTYSPVFM